MFAGQQRCFGHFIVAAGVGQIQHQVDLAVFQQGRECGIGRNAIQARQQLRAFNNGIRHSQNPELGMTRESSQIVVGHKSAAHDRYIQALRSFAWSRVSRTQLASISDDSWSISLELLDTSIQASGTARRSAISMSKYPLRFMCTPSEETWGWYRKGS